jgi:hypothetical protein
MAKNESNPNPGSGLNPDAPTKNLESTIRDAKDDEKPDPSTIAQVEEVKVPEGQ